MSSGASWTAGLKMQAERKKLSILTTRESHLRLMRLRKKFETIFRVPLKNFYTDALVGFDVCAFDEWLMSQDEQYRKANSGELGEDVDCPMDTHIATKYGEKARDIVAAMIR